jgi:carboxymethylenebutenolidase
VARRTQLQSGPSVGAALIANGKTYEAFIYKGANHGFHHDCTPRYDEAMVNLAWDRTLAFFAKTLV